MDKTDVILYSVLATGVILSVGLCGGVVYKMFKLGVLFL